MKHYNFAEIKARGNCIDFVEKVLATLVTAGRCVAVWRDGTRDSVTVSAEKWYDHGEKIGGGLIELCARAKFDQTAAEIGRAHV